MIASQVWIVRNHRGRFESTRRALPGGVTDWSFRSAILPLRDLAVDLLFAGRNYAVGRCTHAGVLAENISCSTFKMSDQSERAEWPVEKTGVRNRICDSQVNEWHEAGEGSADGVVPIDSDPSSAESLVDVSGRSRRG